MALVEPLLCVLLILCLALIAYRGERERSKRRIHDLTRRPSDEAAMLASLCAQMNKAVKELQEAAKPARKPRPEDLPGVQVKRTPGKRR